MPAHASARLVKLKHSVATWIASEREAWHVCLVPINDQRSNTVCVLRSDRRVDSIFC